MIVLTGIRPVSGVGSACGRMWACLYPHPGTALHRSKFHHMLPSFADESRAWHAPRTCACAHTLFCTHSCIRLHPSTHAPLGPGQPLIVALLLAPRRSLTQTDRLWLYEKFAPFGGVLSVRVLTTEAGTCRGVGFINYVDAESAHRAVQVMNGMPLGERRLLVALQTNRQH